jgi:hypothetical protein
MREKIMKKITIVILVLMLGGTLFAYTFKLGILYSDTPAGKSFREGIKAAISDYCRSRENIFASYDFPYDYDKEIDNLETMRSLIKSSTGKKPGRKKVDIILGPTENDIFQRALRYRSEFEKAGTPVISSRVTTNIPHRKGGWFFRTDINVERRARAIYDCLNKYYIRSIVILFEETELGIRAEKAFRRELKGVQKKRYLSLSYDPTAGGRNQIRHILELRPEAVGIFGDRNSIGPLYGSLKRLNTGWPRYLPLTFSITDTRFVRGNPRDNYFVSLTDISENDHFDDVKGLAYDTTILVLQELHALAETGEFNYEDPSWRRLFRKRFEAVLNGNTGFRPGDMNIKSKTGMSFKNYENNTVPKVFKWNNGVFSRFEREKTVTAPEKIVHKLALIRDISGFPVIFNILLIITAGLFLSIWDIKRWHTERKNWQAEKLNLFKNIHFWFLCIFNIAITLAIYIYLGETGTIRYHNFLSAIIVLLATAAVLRAFLFHRATGKSFGPATCYDYFVLRVYHRLTIGKYPGWRINMIAYYKDIEEIKKSLEDIYQEIPGREKRIRMLARMKEVLADADSWIARRKALARLLCQILGWEELVKRDLVPEELETYNPKSHAPITIDPEKFVLEAARCCAHDPPKKTLIDEKINESLEKLKPERRDELKKNLAEEIEKMKTPAAIMRNKIALLLLLQGYDPKFLKNICCLLECEDVLDKASMKSFAELFQKRPPGGPPEA